MFSNVWSENTALFERLMEIHSNSPKLYYGFKCSPYFDRDLSCVDVFVLMETFHISYTLLITGNLTKFIHVCSPLGRGVSMCLLDTLLQILDTQYPYFCI